MRIARVIGKVTLNKRNPDLAPARYLLVRTCSRRTLAGLDAGNAETLVTYDDLGAREGDLIGLVEGREATAPFLPRRVAYDCYNACILEAVNFDAVLSVSKEPVLEERQPRQKRQPAAGKRQASKGVVGKQALGTPDSEPAPPAPRK